MEGRGNTVLISGEAGIGKTRLAFDLMTHAKTIGVSVLSGRAVPHNLTAYLIFVDAFEELFENGEDSPKPSRATRHDPSRELGILGWILGPKTSKEYREIELEPEPRRERLFESVAHLILKTSKKRPILIVLDDLQWADSSSLGLLHYLARNLASTRVLILGAYGTEDLEEDSESGSSFLDTLRLLREEELGEEITLKRLNSLESVQLIRASLQGEPPRGLAEALYRGTEGNPLFILEALKLLVMDGALARHNSKWSLEKPIESLRVPTRVQQLILRRLARLSPPEMRAMECASVIGDPFDSQVLVKILQIQKPELLRMLSDLEKKHRLIHYEEGKYHFDHSKIQEVLYQELGEELRCQYHSEVAEYLKDLYGDDSNAPEALIAYHYQEAGMSGEAQQHYLRAAEEAAHRSEFGTASHLIDRALEASREPIGSQLARVELVQCHIAMAREMWESARAHGAASREAYQKHGDALGEAQALNYLGKIEIRSPEGSDAAAEKYFNMALERSSLTANPEFTASLHTSLAHFYAYKIGDLGKAMNHLAAIEGQGEAIRDPHRRRAFLMVKGWTNLKLAGDFPNAESSFMEALSLSRRIHDEVSFASAKLGLTYSSYYQGNISEARRGFENFAADMIARAVKTDSDDFLGYAVESTCMAAECCMLGGDFEGFRKLIVSLENPKVLRGVEARFTIVLALRGIDQIAQQKREEGERNILEAVHLAEKEKDIERSSSIYFVCGVALHALGEEAEGAKSLKRVEELLASHSRRGILTNLQAREQLAFKALAQI